MGNSEKIILDLCGGTGAWSEPYRRAGYLVIVVTLPEYDLLEYSFELRNKILYLVFQRQGDRTTWVQVSKIYGILFAPVCTHFSRARTTSKTKRNLKDGMILVRSGMDIIWTVEEEQGQQTDNGIPTLKFWAVENPMGVLRRFLGRPKFTFDPCDYGDKYTKKTDIWGWFNEPKKSPCQISKEAMVLLRDNNRKMPNLPGYPYHKRRAITPTGFAAAFYRANR